MLLFSTRKGRFQRGHFRRRRSFGLLDISVPPLLRGGERRLDIIHLMLHPNAMLVR
jgi:hypothetical protein